MEAEKHINKRVPGASTFYPLNEPAIGVAYDAEHYPQNKEIPLLFQPLDIRGVTFKNRIFVSPMCQYSSDNGHATEWHLVAIGSWAVGGAGAITTEATAVVPEGRITPEDAGLWQDSQIAPLKRIVDFAHVQGTKIGIQLAHAGRKASTLAPWVHSDPAHSRVAKTYIAHEDEGGWPQQVYGPSTAPFSETYPSPREVTEADLQQIEDAFVAAVRRSRQAGYDFIEIHGAHGYLIHSFLSPISNTRSDQYGGKLLENRMRFPLRLIERVRAEWEGPLFLRISATDFAEWPEKDESSGEWRQWGIEQSKIFAAEAQKIGIDFIDVSAGGNYVHQKIKPGPGYQVSYAEAIKKNTPNLLVGTVGMITSGKQAEEYLSEGKADVVLLAREFLRNPYFPMAAAQELGIAVKAANQNERAWAKMNTPAKKGEDVQERTKEQGSA